MEEYSPGKAVDSRLIRAEPLSGVHRTGRLVTTGAILVSLCLEGEFVCVVGETRSLVLGARLEAPAQVF